jgi:membrane-bound serine protease (ClpP class)
MRSPIHILLLLFLAAAAGLVRPMDTAAGHINLVTIQDSINPGVEDFIKHSIAQSSEDGAEFLVILLDTPGGLVTSTRGIVQAILNASVPVVVYVYPRGAQAASAGVFVTIAADIAVMAPGTNIGAAHPVATGGQEMSEKMNEKVVNDMVAFAKSLAVQRGRNVEWVMDAVRKSVSITAEEAFEQNVIDWVAEDLPALMERLDGWEIQRAGYSKTLKTRGVEQRTIDPGWQYRILRAISNPNIAYILLMIGLAGLYFELSQPGAILPGVIGGISLIMALYALQTLPVNFAGILLIMLAVIFFILEIKVVSYGMLSIAGAVSLFLGSLMLFRVPGQSTRIAYSLLIPTVLVISGFFAAVTSLAVRAQRSKPQTGSEMLIGMVGEVARDLAPEGKVFVSGELWNAVAEETIAAGEKVEILAVDSLKLKVKKIDAR